PVGRISWHFPHGTAEAEMTAHAAANTEAPAFKTARQLQLLQELQMEQEQQVSGFLGGACRRFYGLWRPGFRLLRALHAKAFVGPASATDQSVDQATAEATSSSADAFAEACADVGTDVGKQAATSVQLVCEATTQSFD
ncbi:unnamed protein product, partial [Polarella glacialis]